MLQMLVTQRRWLLAIESSALAALASDVSVRVRLNTSANTSALSSGH